MADAVPKRFSLNLDGRRYSLEAYRKVTLPIDAPRIVVVSCLQNPITSELLRVCLSSVRRFTPEPHELWVVDNNSPRESLSWLKEWPNINLVMNRTEPVPPEGRNDPKEGLPSGYQAHWGSYANAVALELAVRLIDRASRFFISLHMDALPCRSGWLSYLQSKLSGKVRAVGVRLDRTRTPEGVLHVLGYLVDYQLFRSLDLDFFPELPQFDVGDRVTVRLREAGYEIFACPNTLWEPELAFQIPLSSPFRELQVDRAFDDAGNLIFLHLGRGVRRSLGEHRRGVAPEEWIRAVEENMQT